MLKAAETNSGSQVYSGISG